MFVSFSEIERAYEQPIPVNLRDWVDAKIESAELRLTSFVGDLDAHDPDLVAEVIIGAVLRVLRMPSGVTQTTEGIGPYSIGHSVDPRVAAGTIWFPDEDLALFGMRPRSAMGTARLGIPWRCT